MKGFKIKDLMITVHPQATAMAGHEANNQCITPSRPEPDCYSTSQCATPSRPDCYNTSQCATPSRPDCYMGPSSTPPLAELQFDFTNSDELSELKKAIASMQKKMEPALQEA